MYIGICILYMPRRLQWSEIIYSKYIKTNSHKLLAKKRKYWEENVCGEHIKIFIYLQPSRNTQCAIRYFTTKFCISNKTQIAWSDNIYLYNPSYLCTYIRYKLLLKSHYHTRIRTRFSAKFLSIILNALVPAFFA